MDSWIASYVGRRTWDVKCFYVLRIYFFILFFSSPAFAADLKDVKPPVEVPVSPGWFVGEGLLLVLVSAVAYRIYRQKRRLRMPSQSVNPWQAAQQRLEALHRKDWTTEGKLAEYYTELSGIIRRYIEERFGLRAVEMTTEEFLRSVGASALLTEEQKKVLKDFLSACDLVKFARYGPSPQEIEESWAKARRFVEETRPSEINTVNR